MRHETMYPRPSDEEEGIKKAPGVSSDGHEEPAMCGAQEHSGIVRCIDGGRKSIIGPRLQVRMQGPCSLHFHSVVVIQTCAKERETNKNGGGRKEGSWHWAAEALIG
ncbi:hypothetical protein QR685DRAFT_593916 [Neurospora intermedia]|uniref:Uncharacterized protein n=1 Tax=Neurospora intermedia TaxID=5142 RepID=A0ABR3DSJ0_NEUIN